LLAPGNVIVSLENRNWLSPFVQLQCPPARHYSVSRRASCV
jgi:hypothetical protein